MHHNAHAVEYERTFSGRVVLRAFWAKHTAYINQGFEYKFELLSLDTADPFKVQLALIVARGSLSYSYNKNHDDVL